MNVPLFAQTRLSVPGISSLIVEDVTATSAALPGFDGHERVLVGRDDDRGLTAIIAIHDTTLGPALGGTRIWMHPSFDAAMTDALRLSRGMTLKGAIAGLDFGGGKAVIRADARRADMPRLLEAYAEMLRPVKSSFVTAEDVGMTLADADFLRERTPNVAGTTTGGSGSPSDFTAYGVFLGIRAALLYRTGSDDLAGRHVAIQGLGSVGMALAERLCAHGVRLAVADIDARRTAEAADRFGAEVVGADSILGTAADVLAPCALGAVISRNSIDGINAGIIAGSANNQLARHDDARALARRGILYAPDYVVNAGGLINVAAELEPGGYDRAKVMARIGEIPATLMRIFEEAERFDRPTNDVAFDLASRRLAEARGARSAQ